MPAPPTLARIRDELRALPAKNAAWPSDAILLLRDALREAAIHAEVGGNAAAAAAFHEIGDAAQALAPIFAPTPALDHRAQQLALVEDAIRHGDTA